MASDSSDPSDKSSPTLFGSDNNDSSMDLIGSQGQGDLSFLSMPDINNEFEFPHGLDEKMGTNDSHAQAPESQEKPNTTDLHDNISEAEYADHIEHDDTLADREVQQENQDRPMTATERINALLNDDGADDEECAGTFSNNPQPPVEDGDVPIKIELSEPGTPNYGPPNCIELSDDSDVEEIVRNVPLRSRYRFGNTLPDGTIELSDGEDPVEEIILFDDGSSSCVIKQEDPDIELLGATRGPKSMSKSPEPQPATLGLNLGKSLLRTPNPKGRRTPADHAKLRHLQRLYKEKAIGRAVPSGAGNIFSVPTGASSSQQNLEDSDTWMSATWNEEEVPASHFAELKRAYKAKRKARKNTMVDDVEFRRAEREEKARLKRIELRYLRERGSVDTDDEAEESEDGLFLPEKAPTNLASNKRSAVVIDDDDDNGDGVPKSNARKRRGKDKNKRTRADLDKELADNMLTGIEFFLAKDKKVTKGPEKATERSNRGKKGKGKRSRSQEREEPKSRNKSKKNAATKRPKPTQAGYMNDTASLMTSNVYEDANANLGQAAMPIMTDKRKQEALTSLIAGLPQEEQRKAASEKRHILRMSVVLGHVKASDNGKGWNMKGMTQVLHHHQIQGAGTIKERELGDDEPRGGILADEMGFGKTVMMIANIISNPPSPLEEQKSTLIVCSPAIISQWDEEIAKHTKDGVFPDVLRHHGASRESEKGASGRNAIRKLEKANIVLTTYTEVIKSYPKCQLPPEIETEEEKKKWWSMTWEQDRGLLHKVHFYRVVLDEAQVIKNYKAQTSIACRALMAKHRWAISGTPILNNIEELYPYFKFLRIPHTGSYPVFRQNFCVKDSDICNQRLHAFLDKILIRRTYKSELFLRPIIEMPENHQKTITLEFNSVERKIYDIIQMRFIKAINKAQHEGTLEKRSRLVMTMLLRLRQMTAHIFMLQETMEHIFELEDIEAIWNDTASEVNAESSTPRDMVTTMRKMIAAKNDIPCDEDEEEEPRGDNEQGAALIFKFRKYLRQLKSSSNWSELKERSLCHKCSGPPDEPWITSCLHIYCAECLKSIAHDAAANDQDATTCVACNQVFSGGHPCGGIQELEFEANPTPPPQGPVQNVRPKRGAKDNIKWVDMEGQILPSTKTAAVQAQIELWFEEDPKKKIIVFSQFHLVMQVLGKVCERRGWKYCTYHGKMSHKAREDAIHQFSHDPEKVIMVASLKCGGIGLNLTMASKVICVDLWFNSLVEQQAFCRVFRIGQESETYLTRFVVKDSIDERLLNMQSRKDKIIEAAMDNKTVLSKLTLEEMMHLFGDVVYDGNDKPFIWTEDNPDVGAMLPPNRPEQDDDAAAWSTVPRDQICR